MRWLSAVVVFVALELALVPCAYLALVAFGFSFEGVESAKLISAALLSPLCLALAGFYLVKTKVWCASQHLVVGLVALPLAILCRTIGMHLY